MGQKDLTAKELESRPEVFADIVNALIYQGEQMVAPEELQAAPTETLYESIKGDSDEDLDKSKRKYGVLRDQYSDVSKYEMDKQSIKIQYILENESSENYRLILRKAGYEGAVYRDEYETKQIYPVVILVLYWGDKEWNPHSDLHELFKDKFTDATVKEYVDNIKLHIFHMAHLPKEVRQRFRSDMRVIVDYLVEDESYELTNQEIKYIEPVIRMLYAYTGEKDFISAIKKMRKKQKKGEKVTMNAMVEKFVTRGMDRISSLTRILLERGREGDLKRSLEDKEYREKLLREFDL